MMNLKRHLKRSRNQRSSVLIIVLILVTIVSILLIAYLETMRMERTATRTYSGELTADLVALGGLNRLTADLDQEISAGSTAYTDPNNNPGAPVYYKPNSALAMVPARYNDSSTAYTNLIRVSASNPTSYAAAYPTANYTAGQFPLNLAAASSTLTPSADGRYISASRWEKPQLLLPGETMPAPDWILMTRSGPTNVAGLGFGSSGNTLNNRTPGNPNYVVGRYAYCVYDEGGLLDATVVGAPNSGNGAPSSDDTANRGCLALAALTNTVFTAAQANALTTWRNPASAASASTYTNYVYNVASTNGFLPVRPGDNTFLSRQDLIGYANYAGITSALPYLGTFSRAVNAPAYTPAAASATPVSTGTNPDLMMLRFTNGGTIDSGGTLLKSRTVSAGDFFLTRRFALSRLAWVTYNGPLTTAPPGATAPPSAYDILHAFGLVWDSTNQVWIYVSGAGSLSSTTPVSSIKTLAQVAAESAARDPDFFELLQAGILNSSLGQTGGVQGKGAGSECWGAQGDVSAYDSIPAYQIIQVGVNIMDQASPDSYPIGISFGRDPNDNLLATTGGSTAPYGPWNLYKNGPYNTPSGPRIFYGVENLPYISRLIETYARWVNPPVPYSNSTVKTTVSTSGQFLNLAGVTYTDPWVGAWLQVELWNPHQTTTTNPNPSGYPTAIRIVATGEIQPQVATNTNGLLYTTTTIWQPTLTVSGANSQAAVLQLKTTSFPEPRVVGFGDITPASCGSNCAVDGSVLAITGGNSGGGGGGPFAGLYAGTVYAPDWAFSGGKTGTQYGPVTPSDTNTSSGYGDPYLLSYSKVNMSYFQSNGGVTYALQYTTDGVNWHTYSIVKNIDQVYPQLIPPAVGPTTVSSFTLANSESYADYEMKIDPRTDRFSVSECHAGIAVINASGIHLTPVYGNPVSNSPNYTELYNQTGSPLTSFWTTMTGMPYTCTVNGRTTTWNNLTLPSPLPPGFPANAPDNPNYRITSIGTAGGPSNLPPNSLSPLFFLGTIEENVPTSSISPTHPIYYSDPDGVTRRGDAGYAGTGAATDGLSGVWNASSTNGLNLARPIILNRPFRSVGELGYAFRDLPFKTINFFTKESGDAGLLDLFTVSDADVVAGRIDVNTRNETALAEALTGEAINPLHPSTGDTSASFLSANQATNLARDLVNFTTKTPLRSLSELVTAATIQNSASNAPETILSDSPNAFTNQDSKVQREAGIRALGEAGNARTWNLLIDIIAQSGQYPSSSQAGASLDSFVPNGEKHYWLHIAIDRYTGKVVDRFLEPVQE